jgi:hypothetical protein
VKQERIILIVRIHSSPMSTNTVQEKIKLRLYYWDVCGRVQAIRYMLEDVAVKHSNVEYHDDFELFETMNEVWPVHKADKTISGPFKNLPVLHLNDTYLIAQTLPIGLLI